MKSDTNYYLINIFDGRPSTPTLKRQYANRRLGLEGKETHMKSAWADWEPTYFLASTLIGALFSFLYGFYQLRLRDKQAPGRKETIEERVGKLTDSLKEATSLINNIENEIKARSSLATQLQEDVERFNKLSELKKPEVEAIAQVLRGELAKEGNKAFWKGALVNFVFFLLGAAASWIINILTK